MWSSNPSSKTYEKPPPLHTSNAKSKKPYNTTTLALSTAPSGLMEAINQPTTKPRLPAMASKPTNPPLNDSTLPAPPPTNPSPLLALLPAHTPLRLRPYSNQSNTPSSPPSILPENEFLLAWTASLPSPASTHSNDPNSVNLTPLQPTNKSISA